MSTNEEASSRKLEDLKSQRATTKGCITRIKTIVSTRSDTLTATELECRLGILESYWKAILSHQSAIERLTTDDPNNQVVRGELEDLYCEVKSTILSLLPNKRVSIAEGNSSVFASPPYKPKLPPLKLPQFSGKYSEYPNFIAVFNKLVHDDADKSITEKYNHLLSCLSGAALRCVESLGKSATTYPRALEKLKERFDNKCLIFQEHIKEMFELPKSSNGSASQLRHLLDNVGAHLSALRTLGNDTEVLNSVIIYLVNSKLDKEFQAKWDEAIDYSQYPTWKKCEEVLSRHCLFLEAIEKKSVSPQSAQQNQKLKTQKSSLNRAPTALKITHAKCTVCSNGHHTVTQCPKFAELPVLERFETAKRLSLCINCLTKGHSLKACRSSKCRVCSRPHHTLLHRFPESSPSAGSPSPSPSPTPSSIAQIDPIQSPASLCSAAQEVQPNISRGYVILATALIFIKDKWGHYQPARALLDSASQLNFVTSDLSHRLGLKRRLVNSDISGIGDTTTHVRYEVCCSIKSRINDFHATTNMYVLPAITGLQPETHIDVRLWKIPHNIQLADPTFFKPQRVDVLLGADKFLELLSVGQIKLADGLPRFQKTLLGWIVCGAYEINPSVRQANILVSVVELQHKQESLSLLVEKFWEIENVPITRNQYTAEQQGCEEHFLKTVRTSVDGRFIVRLPLKSPPTALGESYETAKRRLATLERKLERNPAVKKEYHDFLREYYDLNHMEAVSDDETSHIRYYMPHSCVLRPESSSTKLRVVFDASCATSSQISLNDILMVGPTVQNNLVSILIRFRCWKFALTADIHKMYRQIQVDEADRDLQCILWRNFETGELQTFRLNTVTYGTAAAPYLATRCLQFLAEMNERTHPGASKVIKEDFYVDDLLTGADSEQEVLQLQNEIQQLLSSRGFELKKWYSNADSVLLHIPESHVEKPLKLHDLDIIKTLGIAWEPTTDNFVYSYIAPNRHGARPTKRTILSDISKLFDPLGLVNPFVVKGKIFLQELWLLNVNWDESLPMELSSRWEQYLEDSKTIHTIQVPRFILSMDTSARIELHGFSDASTRAYGCCIYSRSIDVDGHIDVNLLIAKSKVAPTRIVRTLPSLELCGAELLAQAYLKVRTAFQKSVDSAYLWTDSQVVLGWISSHAANWKPFVANRVSVIQESTGQATWRYVPSKMNPADMVSRGATMAELKNSMWYGGPDFLQHPEDCWPSRKIKLSDLPERRKQNTVLIGRTEESFVANVYRWSSYTKVLRIFARILRFTDHLRHKKPRDQLTDDCITATEMEAAMKKIVWIVQRFEFVEEIAGLEKSGAGLLRSPLQILNPFLDEAGLLRVGGRLANADLPYAAKHPLLLPKDNNFAIVYLSYLHIKNFHAGAQALVALSRQQVWIMNARRSARKVVRECVHCFKYKPRLLRQLMGDLPKARLVGGGAFESVGVDYCGPIWTTHRMRGKPRYKTYICVFVCFLSRGVHL